MPTMATPKKSSKPEKPGMTTRGLRMSTAYNKWLVRFAKKERMSIATLIDCAMDAYAMGQGFEEPPDRVL